MADGLRNDFADVQNGDGGGEKAGDAAEEVCGDDGEGRVDGGVSDEQGAQEPVAMSAHGEDAAGVPALVIRAGLCQDAEVDDVQGHEAEREAGKGAGEDDADECDDDLPPEDHGLRGRT